MGTRCRGALIVTEKHSTHPTDWPYEKLIHGFHRDVIPGYRRITEAVHRLLLIVQERLRTRIEHGIQASLTSRENPPNTPPTTQHGERRSTARS